MSARWPARGTAAWVVVLGLALTASLLGPASEAEPRRWLGAPLRELASDVAWIRFQRARLAGDHEQALRHAARALEHAPERAQGWELLAGYLGYELASPAIEPDAARRRAWFEASIACLLSGEARVRAPERLAQSRGTLLWNKAAGDPLVAGDGDATRGARALFERAAQAFEAAGQDTLAALVRQQAESP